jgi:choline dehydrogenase-like flavoprotein
MADHPDIVIVGGGIGGGSLATVLARDWVSVAVLERDPQPLDRVRGESWRRGEWPRPPSLVYSTY